MLTNAEFAQITGIAQNEMTAELAELALFSLPIACEDGKTRELWSLRAKSPTTLARELGQDQASWAKEEERRRQANVAYYAELVDRGFCDGEEIEGDDASLTDHALYIKGED